MASIIKGCGIFRNPITFTPSDWRN